MYLKYTGTLDCACNITLAPNTISKLWFIENATKRSTNGTISQGSGANVTIPNGVQWQMEQVLELLLLMV